MTGRFSPPCVLRMLPLCSTFWAPELGLFCYGQGGPLTILQFGTQVSQR